jgi:hypothetical protein
MLAFERLQLKKPLQQVDVGQQRLFKDIYGTGMRVHKNVSL